MTDAVSLDVEEAIFTTRATRRLRPDSVPDEVVWAILDAAICGPSGGNCQRWGWIVVTDRAVKEQIGDWYLQAWNRLRPGRRARAFDWLARSTRGRIGHHLPPVPDDVNYRSGRHLAENIADAPVWIFAVVCETNGEPTLVDGANIFGAVQNLMLSARKHGLGTTLTMLHRAREEEVSQLLGIPPNARPVALIPIGYPETTFGRVKRKPVETVTHWGRWGETREHRTRRDESWSAVASGDAID